MIMPTLKRRFKTFGKQGLRTIFELSQHLGVDILPRHYYSEIPDFQDLRGEDDWKQPRSMVGINGIDIPDQLAFVRDCCPAPLVKRLASGDIHSYACTENGESGFGPVEADFLHAFIASHRPRRIIQVGCGVSTAVILRAAKEVSYTPELLCIEPFPTEFIRAADRAERIELVPRKAQRVPLEVLTELDGGDLLFVDSSHTVKPGSEVNRLILEVLPRLKRDTWVHFHDIFFPYDYQRGLLADELFFCNESVLLQAYLTNNPRYTIRASLSMLHYAAPDALQECLPNYQPAKNEQGLKRSEDHFPASTYLQVIA
jgi:predicted O-methyltransferase YrrM